MHPFSFFCSIPLTYCYRHHSDAPALSNNADIVPTTGALPLQTDAANEDAQWDDEALAAKTRKGVAVVVPAGATTKDLVVETKALSLKTHTGGNEQEVIAEKLRVEETKKKLAAAREGMEREAQRLKEAKEKKEEAATSNNSSRFGAAAAAGNGGKWVSSRVRSTGSGMGSGWGAKMGGASIQRKVDVEDENLFPDLAAADAILEKQKAEQPAYKAPTKTPVGGGATWGAPTAPKSRPKLNLKKKAGTPLEAPKTEEVPAAATPPPPAAAAAAAPAEEPNTEVPSETATEAAPTEPESAAPAAALKPKKKKKKKDLSTFGKK